MEHFFYYLYRVKSLKKMSSRCHPDCQRAAAAKEEDGNFYLGFA